MPASLAHTPLHDWHVAHGARMVDFAGWSMPVQYASIVAEHLATRRAAGLFDISHMGRIRFDGPAAAAYVDSLVTRRVDNLRPGQIRYALVTNHRGGVLDDVLVYHLQDAAGGSYYLMVVNASNRQKILAWIAAHPSPGDVQVSDLTTSWAMIAVQGPLAIQLLQPLVETDLARMKYYSGQETRIAGHGGVISRTGYTGEDGCEVIVGRAVVESLWEGLLQAGADHGVLPAGLGARDTLRLEAAMPLYGHELNEDVTPLQAGLRFAVDLDKTNLAGRHALRAAASDPNLPRLVGLRLAGKRVPREGFAVRSGGQSVGRVTSGTFSPTLQAPIALAYVPPQYAEPGMSLAVEIRGSDEPATVVKLPFYQRPR
jgi:aminomethyltransferase